MTRTDKASLLQDRTSASKAFTERYNEACGADRQAGRALTANRFTKINANNELEPADRHDAHWFGIPYSQADIARGDKAFTATRGPAYAIAQGGRIESQQEFKVGKDGKITKFVRASPARVVMAATDGEVGEITDDDGNNELLKVVSNNAADINLWVLVAGKEKTSGDGIIEYIYLNGTTSTNGALYFDDIYGAVILDAPNLFGTATAPTGSVTVKNQTGTTLITLAAVAHMGLSDIDYTDAYDRRVNCTLSALAADSIVLAGIDENGDEISELITWTAATGIVLMESVERYNRIIYCIGGKVADARTMTIDGQPNEYIFNGWTNMEHETTTDDAADKGGDASISAVSDDAGDTTQTITVALKNAAGAFETVTKTLTGTDAVVIEATSDAVIGAYLSAATLGTITIATATGPADLLVWDGALYLGAGMVTPWGGNAAYAGIDLDCGNGKVTITCSNGAATDFVVIQGFDRDGTATVEGNALVAGTKEFATYWSKITHIFSSGTESTESFKLHLATDDDGALARGVVIEPSDADADKIEVLLY